MDQQNHQSYYVVRATASRDLAQRATSPAIAAIHTDLAARYDLLASQIIQPVDRTTKGLQAT